MDGVLIWQYKLKKKDNIMKLVQQVTVDTGKEILKIRYNVDTGLLYQQNRSKDVVLTKVQYCEKLTQTSNVCKEKGYKMTVLDVPENSKW
jgi:hypothetical protein